MNYKINTVFEYELIKFDDIYDLKGKKIENPDELIEELNNINLNKVNKQKNTKKLRNFYVIDHRGGRPYGIKFKNYVGFVRLGDVQFEIFPKIWKTSQNNVDFAVENFSKFFIYGNLNYNELKNYKRYVVYSGNKNGNGFMNMLVSHYALSMQRELKDGPFSDYIEIEERGKFLRGRLDLKKHLNSIDKSLFNVKYYNKSHDIQLNRNFLYATEYMIENISESHVNELSLSSVYNMIPDDVTKQKEWNNREIHFNRLNDRFEVPYNYADLIVNGGFFSHRHGKKYYSFLYDMNKLFENFIYRAISLNYDKIFGKGFKKEINFQKGEKNFLFDGEEHSVLTRPDIIIKNNGHKIIIDTKYKIMESIENEDNSETICGKKVDSSHLYQIYTYSQLYKADRAVILFPLEILDSMNNQDLVERDIKISCKYSFTESENSPTLKLFGIPLDLSGETRVWEEKLVNNLKECLTDW